MYCDLDLCAAVDEVRKIASFKMATEVHIQHKFSILFSVLILSTLPEATLYNTYYYSC